MFSLPSFARDFSYTYEGQTLWYTVIDEAAKTVEVKDGGTDRLSGVVKIPGVAIDSGVEYSVTAIGKYAFYSTELTSLTIPISVTYVGARSVDY